MSTRKDIVQSVDRALTLLECLAEETDGLGVTELSNRLDLPKSTISRFLKTLLERQYIRQNPKTGRYQLGLRILYLYGSLMDHLDVRKVALPYLEALCRETNEVIHLCVRDGAEVVYVEKVESETTIRMHSKVGNRVLMHCTAVGKVLLSELEEDEVAGIISRKGMPRKTENTITDLNKLLTELSAVRSQGYAIDDIEHEEGIRCIGAPIRNHAGQIVAAISISGPTFRMTKERVEQELSLTIKYYAQLISSQLGYTCQRR
ncbi:DNA-binding IclR family transcriptional regulator [Caldalkalibacillus uzonensis]|uniref:DNA-binding IclR family transcriptional regulator n=1 Tax=Caldalkalibacillus uzonensis TaxID=353224 RepID=A0ABU0CPB9_9BACI|nr:IclR family transcriptional regulator [Caldalkalibacillus uzonensis]MDQ0338258.1 DNA-binding IclR family transcriptional regulator [Caldalkalibacillus uzonensis]